MSHLPLKALAVMVKTALFALLFLALGTGTLAHAAESKLVFLVPVRDAGGKPLTERRPNGDELVVAEALNDAALKAKLQSASATGILSMLPALDTMARAKSRQTYNCPQIGPAVLVFLSDEDGGYARKDLLIDDGQGKKSLCSDYYIDISVDAGSIADGQFEEVLAHEFGHMLLRRILGPVAPTMSRNGHSVLVITDPATAFDEGFGEHFQPLALALTASDGFRARARALNPSTADYWLSRRETWLRETAVPRGDFLFGPVRPDTAATGLEGWRLSQTNYSYDPCKVRSGEALMASEGVAATFFYRLLAPDMDRDKLLERYDRLVRVLAAKGNWRTRAPLVDLVQGWGDLYPDDKARLIRLFLEVTGGATLSAELQEQTARLSCTGAHGKLAQFLADNKAYRQAIGPLVDSIGAGQRALDAHLAPELWLANPAVRIPPAPWDEQLSEPFVIDLNTADHASLTYLLGNNAALSARLLEARTAAGFADMKDVITRAGLSQKEASTIEGLHRNAAMMPAFTRQ